MAVSPLIMGLLRSRYNCQKNKNYMLPRNDRYAESSLAMTVREQTSHLSLSGETVTKCYTGFCGFGTGDVLPRPV